MTAFRYKRLTAMILIIAVFLASMNTNTAAALSEANSADSAASAPESIRFAESGYAELKQIHLLPDQSGPLAVFTITLHNEGNSELSLLDYWVRLQSKAGHSFTARPLPKDKDKTRVAPGSSVDLTFYANVNESVNLHELVIQLVKGDFTQANFERVVGELFVPDSYSNVTAAGDSRLISIGAADVKAAVSKLAGSKNEKNYMPTIYLTLENAGSQPAVMPGYSFSIRTEEGLLYPLEAKGWKAGLSIKPKESKELQLTGTVPVSASADGWQLVITDNTADSRFSLPVAAFQLPPVSRPEGRSVGKPYSFAGKSGNYGVQLNALYRLPWEDQDILSADLTLSNKGAEPLPLPELSGYFLLDETLKIDAKLVQTEKVIGLGAGAIVGIQLAGKVPYIYEFSKIKLVLQEKEDAVDAGKETDAAQSLKDVLELVVDRSELQAIPFYPVSESYLLKAAGHQTKFLVRSVSTYTSSTTELFTAQVEAFNEEKRYANVPRLVAHFRADDGTVFPASIAEVKNKVGPGGRAILNVYAVLPSGYPKQNLQLLIGEATLDGMVAESDKKADSYVKPAVFGLPVENKEVTDKLTGVRLFPYSVTINRMGTSVENNKLTFKFDYEITKDSAIEVNTEGHKLVLVFEDNNGRKSFERAFDVKDIEAVDTVPEASANITKLKLGKHENAQISVTDSELIYKLQFLKQYSVRLYDEFQNQRRLLAEQKADWFVYTE